ncbi:FCD domain-containing protein [Williamsia sp.]|uniref:FCD domain-containing protein n=1 Tax=Williamsia sp. TaxID=1872085 RepID=UPI002F91CEF8
MITQRGDDELLELFEAQPALDAAVASAAADRRIDVDLLRLQDALDRSMQHEDPVDVRLALRQWHAALREAAHNRTMTDLLDRLDAQIELGAPWKPSYSDGAFERPIAEHREILAAVRARPGRGTPGDVGAPCRRPRQPNCRIGPEAHVIRAREGAFRFR